MARRKRGFFAELQHQRIEQQRQETRCQREQQRLAAQAQREQERAQRATERADAQAERDRKARHIERRQTEAAAMTRTVQDQVDSLASILSRGIERHSQISFDQLRKPLRTKPFKPGQLAIPAQAPQWEAYAPPQPSGLGKLFGKSTYERALADAQQAFTQAAAQHQEQERQRLAKLTDAQRKHNEAEQWRRQEVEKINAQVDALERGFESREPQAIEDYFELALESAPLPAVLPVDVNVLYQPEARRLLVVRALPNVDVM